MAPCHTGEKWSSYFSGLQDGDFAYIPAGKTVVLDITTPKLGGVFVEGILVFDHTVLSGTVHLKSAYMVVTGKLQIGCKSALGVITRFTKNATLTLIMPERYLLTTTKPLTAGVNWPTLMENRFINVPPGQSPSPHVKEAALDRGLVIVGTGEVYVFGNDSREQSWTTLALTAAQNQDLLKLDDPLAGSWKLNDELVIASTDFEYADQWANGALVAPAKMGGHPAGYSQGEERFIFGFTGNSDELVLNQILGHQHFSATTSATFPSGADSITEKCEVGNLTRSVVIRGEQSAYSSSVRGGTRHSGHVILVKENGVTTIPHCEVDWAEFRDLGVEGKLGRYPFHWHMLGNAQHGTNLDHPYLRDCSIHHCLNRFVTVHNTQYVDVERNVGFDTLGSGFFLEDADEFGTPLGDQVQQVLLKDNLGLKVDRPVTFVAGYPALYQILDTRDPSVFWIQHPNQQVEGNHAAGAAGHGFYLAPNDLADGYSHPPANPPGGSNFRNNVAHSNGQHGFYHQSRVKWNWQAGDSPAGEGLVAWKNRRYGIWWRTYGVSLLTGCKVADNKSGIYPASEGRQDAHDGANPPTCRLTFSNSLIFGETPNAGEPINDAEVDAVRSLPQTYWFFTRPDDQSMAHESEWDTMNGLESYDGQNLFTGLKLAYFPASRTLRKPQGGGATALQRIAALTQVEYNSEFAEDPRNRVIGLEFATGTGQVVNRMLNRGTNGPLGYSMIRNTVVFDDDNSLGQGSDVYLCYNDSFFEANATALGTQDIAHNLLILSTAVADFAQFQINATSTAALPDMTVTVNHQTAGTASQTLGLLPGGPSQDYCFNAPIGLDTNPLTNREGIYTCSFLMGTVAPTAYEIKIQFAEAANIPTIIGVPLALLGPNGVKLNGSQITTTATSRDALLNLGIGFPNAYFHDMVNSVLYIKTTTIVLPFGGSADVDGTRNILEVN